MIRQSIEHFLAAFGLVSLLAATAASADVLLIDPVPDVTVSVGYSNLQTQRTNNLFYDHDGAYVDADFAWWLPLKVPLTAGIGVTGSGYSDRRSTDGADNYSYNYYGYDGNDQHLYSDLGLVEIEPRLGLHLGGARGLFAIPRVGAGLLVSSYDVDRLYTDNSNGESYISTDRHTGAAFEIRPAIRAGYAWRFVTAGVDASYMYSWGNFGAFGRNAHEYRIGLFVQVTF